MLIINPENTDNKRRLKFIFKALNTIADQIMPIIFPIHPRTLKLAEKKQNRILSNKNIILMKPVGYFEFLGLLSYSHIALTDSGGVQEEALTLKTPCITLRYNTERWETIEAGGHVLAGANTKTIIKTALKIHEKQSNKKTCTKIKTH